MKALVTGAAGFIGASLSGALLRRGYNVIGIDNLNDYYDVSLKEARLKLLRCKPNFQFQKLDIFVGNHGIWPPQDEPVATLSNDRWNRTIDANLNSIFYTCRAAASRLNQHGRIVLVSSTAAQRGEAFHADYAATKGAMISLVKGLCIEVAPRGITVNAVAPGWIDTEMSASAFVSGERERITRSIPIGRIATAKDVAGPIVFLCSELARHITGEVININGGAVLPG